LKQIVLPTSLSDVSYISSCRIAGRSAFIYAIYETNLRLLYIGQTRNPYGALGRFSQHLSWDTAVNTFRQRSIKVLNLDEVFFNDIFLLSIPLPDDSKFYLPARDYREAVESLVYDFVLDYITKNNLRLLIVSTAYRHPYRKEKEIIDISKRISDEINLWISE